MVRGSHAPRPRNCAGVPSLVYAGRSPPSEGTGAVAAGQGLEGRVTVTVYGIRNCDTVKKARAWLDGQGIGYAFHDYKSAGAPPELLKGWADQVGWEVLLNKAGMTFRKLDDAAKVDLDEAKAIALMSAQPSMIKRPVVDADGRLIVGFKPDAYAAFFAG